MALRTLALVLLAAASLTACGSRANDPVLGLARGLVAGNEAAAPAVDPRQVLTRAMIDEVAAPLILVESLQSGSTSTLALAQTNGSNQTWRGADDVTVTLSREGVLRATRGLGHDLMISDINGTRVAVAARRTTGVSRQHVYLTAQAGEDRIGYQCAISNSGSEGITIFGVTRTLTRLSERCTPQGGGEGFENRYWVDGSGFAWASEQFVSAERGHLRIERLYR